jgi:hypothetical protein
MPATASPTTTTTTPIDTYRHASTTTSSSSSSDERIAEHSCQEVVVSGIITVNELKIRNWTQSNIQTTIHSVYV